MKVTATVSIGRNIVNEPMLSDTWANFRLDVEDAIRTNGQVETVYVGDALGGGIYKNQAEESATWVFELDLDYFGVLRQRLARLANSYAQDSIALTIGHTELVERAK